MSEIDTINLPEPFIDVYRWTYDHYQPFPDRFTLQLRQSLNQLLFGNQKWRPESYKHGLRVIRRT